MTSRRSLLLVPFGAGLLRAKASQPSTPVNFAVPKGACDCHTHIFGDPAAFPFAKERSYTPEQALPREMRALHKALHVDRVVIVTPSVYGTDNSATAAGIRSVGLKRARGIAVIASDTSARELSALDRAGFRGIRLNFGVGAAPDLDAMRSRLRRSIEQVKPLGWHIQIYTNLAAITKLEADLMAAAPMRIVLDHVCGAVPELGVGQAGFEALLRLVRAGHVSVKITHRFISTARHPQDAGPLAQALIAANRDCMLWGTDWPHPDSAGRPGRKATDVAPFEAIDDGAFLNLFGLWAGSALRGILVENPARLYGFVA